MHANFEAVSIFQIVKNIFLHKGSVMVAKVSVIKLHRLCRSGGTNHLYHLFVVADPGFPEGAPTPEMDALTYYYTIIWPKTTSWNHQ